MTISNLKRTEKGLKSVDATCIFLQTGNNSLNIILTITKRKECHMEKNNFEIMSGYVYPYPFFVYFCIVKHL